MNRDPLDELHICSTCAVALELKALAEPASPSPKCVLCDRVAGEAIDLNRRRVQEVFRALLRYHFSEWAYNGHLDGDEISRVLSRPNPIIDHTNELGVEDVCLLAQIAADNRLQLNFSRCADGEVDVDDVEHRMTQGMRPTEVSARRGCPGTRACEFAPVRYQAARSGRLVIALFRGKLVVLWLRAAGSIWRPQWSAIWRHGQAGMFA